MKILKYKKLSKDRYKVTFDKTEIILYIEVILKYNLLLEKDISLSLLDKIIKENTFYEAYNISLNQISYKLRTEKEIKNNLEKKGYEEKLIDKVINELKKNKYIDETKYIEAYVNDKINLTSYGSYKIKKELLDLGLDSKKIDEYLDKIPNEVWNQKLDKLIEKKFSLMKNKSLKEIKNKLNIFLFNLGYDKYEIEKRLDLLEKDDTSSIIKDYEKAEKRYKETIKIKNYLYRKGYNLDLIEEIMNKKSSDRYNLM